MRAGVKVKARDDALGKLKVYPEELDPKTYLHARRVKRWEVTESIPLAAAPACHNPQQSRWISHNHDALIRPFISFQGEVCVDTTSFGSCRTPGIFTPAGRRKYAPMCCS